MNQYGNFCVNSEFSEGTCCEWEEEDCGQYMSFCANDIKEEARFEGQEYWVCPREDFCQELVQVVQIEEKLISVPFGTGFRDDHLCTYWFQFSVHAGPGDLMQIEFSSVKNAGMTFSAGISYASALTGAKMNEPEGGKISVPYPNSLFITFFNTGSDGALEIKSSYQDNSPEDAIQFMGITFELEKATGKCRQLRSH